MNRPWSMLTFCVLTVALAPTLGCSVIGKSPPNDLHSAYEICPCIAPLGFWTYQTGTCGDPSNAQTDCEYSCGATFPFGVLNLTGSNAVIDIYPGQNGCNDPPNAPIVSTDTPDADDIALNPSTSSYSIAGQYGLNYTQPATGTVALSGAECSGTCPVTLETVRVNIADFTATVPPGVYFGIPIPTSTNVPVSGAPNTSGASTGFNSVNDGTYSGTMSANQLTFPPPVSIYAWSVIDGNPASDTFTSTSPVTGTFDPVAGAFTMTGTFVGSDPNSGTITMNLVGNRTQRPPIPITAASQTVACNPSTGLGSVPLNGSQSSDPDGLPFSVAWVDGPGFSNLLASTPTATISLPLGTTNVTLVAYTSAKAGFASDVIRVVDSLPPIVNGTTGTEVLTSCTFGGPIQVPLPQVVDMCSPSVSLTGAVISVFGSPVNIPIGANGSVTAGPGPIVVQWTAVDASGLTTVIVENFTVEPWPTIYATDEVELFDNAVVRGNILAAGDFAFLGNNTVVDSVYSTSRVIQLLNGVTATTIGASGTVQQGVNDHIGSLSTNVPTFPPFPSISPTFTGGSQVLVNGGQTITLAPGQYGQVQVFSGGTLVLSAGNYDITLFALFPQATIVVPTAAETVRVFVRDNILYQGNVVASAGGVAPLYLAYTGNLPVQIQSPFLGTIIAPNAVLQLEQVQGTHSGEFFANEVEVQHHFNDPSIPDVTSNPFTCP
jgi:hypothetical protein